MSLALLLVLGAAAPLTVAVMPFDNRTGDAEYDVMEKGLADMLLTDLAAAEGLTIVERSRLNDVIGELKLQRSALFDAATVARVGKLVGATHLVAGQVLKVAPELRLDVRLVELGSGKVLYGANVSGKTDRLFELEQELVTRFLDGLGKKGVLPTRSGPAKLETLLAYSQALAVADSGDLKGASTKLASVMKTDSDFRLAKSRYTELLKRLREAGARREEALTTGEAELLARIESQIAKPDPGKPELYLGYRAMRAKFVLMQLKKVTGPPSVPDNPKLWSIVRRSQRAKAQALVKEHFAAHVKSMEEQERLKRSPTKTPDHERANELGLGDYAEVGYSGWFGRLVLAELLFKGELRTFYGFKLSPVPAVLEPSLAEPGLELFDQALKLLENDKDKNERLKNVSQIAVAHGEALLVLGRREEAIARWQQALDEMPTGPLYKEIEERVEKALGVHALWKGLDTASACDQSLMGAWSNAAYVLFPYDVEALFARADKSAALCSGKTPQYAAVKVAGYMQLAYAASLAGDCPTWARATALAKKLEPDTGKNLEAYAPGCLEWEK